ncbi:hypothetical protein DRA43_25875, partial [Micromonospora provocatoris]
MVGADLRRLGLPAGADEPPVVTYERAMAADAVDLAFEPGQPRLPNGCPSPSRQSSSMPWSARTF